MAASDRQPRKLVFNESLLRSFAEGYLAPEIEDKVAAYVEKRPELLDKAVAISDGGFLDKLKAVHQRLASSQSLVEPVAVASRIIDSDPTRPEKKTALPAVPSELENYSGYRVIRELGRGGMGVVFLAKNIQMDRLEVLKVLNERLLGHEGAKERFLREIRAVSKLNHSNIVTSYSVLPLEKLLVFAMEHVHGMDLQQFVHRHICLPIGLACSFARQIAAGLQHAHEKGLVHRDIKPSNAIVYKAEGQLQLKILDFGLAKATSEKNQSSLTQDGMMLGTPEYMSPEQTLNAARADIRADIYSLGCTLNFMLIGEPPYHGTHGEVMMAHAQQEPPSLSLVRPEIPIELASVVRRMMAKQPAQRYRTPADVALALKPFLNTSALSRDTNWRPVTTSTITDLSSPSRDTPVEAPVPVLSQTPEHSIARDLSPQEQNVTIIAVNRHGRLSRQLKSRAPGNWFSNKVHIAIPLAGAFLAGLLWLGVLTFRTPNGSIIVENLPPDAHVLIDGERLEIQWNEGKDRAQISVTPGKRKIEVLSKGARLFSETVDVAVNGQVPLKIGFSAAPDFAEIPDAMPAIDISESGTPHADNQSATQAAWKPLFNGTDFTGWRLSDETANTWSMQNGELVGAGNEVPLVSVDDFTEFELEVEVAISGANSGLFFGGTNGYECELCIPSADRFHALGSILLGGEISNRQKPSIVKRVLPKYGQWFRLSLLNTRDKLQVHIDDELIVNDNGPRPVAAGPIKIEQWTSGGHIAFRNMRIRDLQSPKVPVDLEAVPGSSSFDSLDTTASSEYSGTILGGEIQVDFNGFAIRQNQKVFGRATVRRVNDPE